TSALKGIPEFSVGNVIGSNIVDFTFAAGLTAVLARSIKIDNNLVKKDLLYMLGLALLPVFLLFDHHLFGFMFPSMIEGLSRIDGIILLCAFFFYLFNLIKQESKFPKTYEKTSKKEATVQIIILLFSLAMLLLSANFVIDTAQLLSIDLKIPPLVLGLFLIAIGTSLPEIMFETRAAMTGHQSMAIGDLMGSVIANSTLIIGISALILPIKINSLVYITSMLFMVFTAFIFFAFAKSEGKLTWKEGITLIMLYVLFIFIEGYFRIGNM
ncbi:MAG: hypothetical protein NDI94_02350, partial [Candidatus Woesearchaeota archaeon]|nr:hypothetical protein [Candidatus Woesearchaeota archaeon]